jgi:hypothetical protein
MNRDSATVGLATTEKGQEARAELKADYVGHTDPACYNGPLALPGANMLLRHESGFRLSGCS